MLDADPAACRRHSSALRIASHSSDLSYRPPPAAPAPTTTLATHHRRRPRVGRAGAPDAPNPAGAGEHKQEGQAINFDDVVTEVLADTWDLPEHQPVQEPAGEAPPSQGPARSYEELMKELEGTGLSVDDLSEALSEAYRD